MGLTSFRRVFGDDQVLPPQLPVIPAPVGGTPSPTDFAPSCLFVALYALLVPLALYRICAKSSRNLIVVFTLGLLVERIVFFVIRAWEAHAPDAQRTSPVFLAYAQSTLAAGFVSIGKDLVAAVRCLLVRAVTTRPSEVESDEPASAFASPEKSPTLSRTATFADEPPKMARISTLPLTFTIPVLPRSPVARRWRSRRTTRSCGGRRWLTPKRERMLYDVACVCMSVAFVIVVAVSLWSGGVYSKGMYYQSWANRTILLRYISCGLGLLFISIVHLGAYWAWARNPTMGHVSVSIISAICTLLSVVGIYRLIVVGSQTENLLTLAPGSLNDIQSKATFYVFHVAPEWLAVAILLGVNVRERFVLGGKVDATDSAAAAVIAVASMAV